MRVLYIATSFPEPDKGATIYTDLAEALNESGHEITVAVVEQSKNRKSTQLREERGFNVLRVVVGNYFEVSNFEKGLTTLKIPVLMKKSIERFLGHKEFDLILFESPPVTNAGLVDWAKKKFDCPSYLMLKDIFPQNSADLGILKQGGLTFKYFLNKEKKLYKIADYIGCMSLGCIQYLLKHNAWLEPEKVELFPNTKKLTNNFTNNKKAMRGKLGIPEDACLFLFGGNMGKPQYIDLLCKALENYKDYQRAFFLFIGRGTDRYKLDDTIKNNDIKNAMLINNLPRDDYERIVKECDVGLIILDPRFTIPNYPSRILSYMEYAKPILAATDMATDIRNLIEDSKCGKWVWSGDTERFLQAIIETVNSDELSLMGENGRKFAEKHFDVNRSIDILETHFDIRKKEYYVQK